MDSRKVLDTTSIGLMTVLCVIWGLTQVVLKLAAPDITPLMQIALRSGFAALLVALLMDTSGATDSEGWHLAAWTARGCLLRTRISSGR